MTSAEAEPGAAAGAYRDDVPTHDPAAPGDSGETRSDATGEMNGGDVNGGDVTADPTDRGDTDMGTGASGSHADSVFEGTPVAAERGRISVSRIALGGALIAGDHLRDGVRSVSGLTASMLLGVIDRTRERTDRAREKLLDVMDDADRRGRDEFAARRHEATELVNTTVEDAVSWAEVKIVPQLIDDLVPHLISSVVPRIIDGAMPEIRERIIPVIIGDLTTDDRVQELILAQSRGVLGQLAEQLRTNTVRADDRLEAAAQRVVGRSERSTAAKGNAAKDFNEIRGV